MVYGQARPRRRRGRRALIALIIVLVVLIAAFLVADRWSRSVADQKVADELAAQAQSNDIHLGSEPTVDITGFPFLTQVASGRYGKVLVHLRDVTAEGYSMPTLDATATGVHAKASDLMHGTGTITADRVDGTGVIGYPYLAKAVQDQIRLDNAEVTKLTLAAPHGALKAHAKLSMLGQRFTVIGTVKLSLAGNAVRVRVSHLSAAGADAPSYLSAALDGLAEQFATRVALPDLPYGLRFDSLHPAPAGLTVGASARNVSLAQ